MTQKKIASYSKAPSSTTNQ